MLTVRTNENAHELIWNEDVVAYIESREAAEELCEALWLLKHLIPIAKNSLSTLTDVMKASGFPKTETDQRFLIETNFLLELLKRREANVPAPRS